MFLVREVPINHKTSFGVKIKTIVYTFTPREGYTHITFSYSWWARQFPDIVVEDRDLARNLPGCEIKSHSAVSREATIAYSRILNLSEIIYYLREAFKNIEDQARSLQMRADEELEVKV